MTSPDITEPRTYGAVTDFNKARANAWELLGTDVTGREVTAEQAMILAGLDWTVEKHPVQATVAVPELIDMNGVTPASTLILPATGKFATIKVGKDGTREYIGVVGSSYVPVQNLQSAEALNTICEVAGATINVAGPLAGGKRTFVQMKMPEGLTIGGRDAVDTYLIATNSHDGTSSLHIYDTMIRLACSNQLTATKKNSKNSISLRHSSGIQGHLKAAQDLLRITNKFMDEFKEMGDALIGVPMNRTEFGEFVEALYKPTHKKTGPNTGQETEGTAERRNRLFGLWVSETQSNIAGTRWAAYNAVAEELDWFSPVKSKDPLARAEKIAAGFGTDVKARALTLLR